MTSLSQCRGAQSLCTSQSTTVHCAASFCCAASHLLYCATCRMKVDLTKFTETHEFTFDEVFGHNVDTREVGVAPPPIALPPCVLSSHCCVVIHFHSLFSSCTSTLLSPW